MHLIAGVEKISDLHFSIVQERTEIGNTLTTVVSTV